jgi:polyisoprenoid-binding protein YceI
MTTQTVSQQVPAGTYEVDPVHSTIHFAVVHNGVSTFRSGFRDTRRS